MDARYRNALRQAVTDPSSRHKLALEMYRRGEDYAAGRLESDLRVMRDELGGAYRVNIALNSRDEGFWSRPFIRVVVEIHLGNNTDHLWLFYPNAEAVNGGITNEYWDWLYHGRQNPTTDAAIKTTSVLRNKVNLKSVLNDLPNIPRKTESTEKKWAHLVEADDRVRKLERKAIATGNADDIQQFVVECQRVGAWGRMLNGVTEALRITGYITHMVPRLHSLHGLRQYGRWDAPSNQPTHPGSQRSSYYANTLNLVMREFTMLQRDIQRARVIMPTAWIERGLDELYVQTSGHIPIARFQGRQTGSGWEVVCYECDENVPPEASYLYTQNLRAYNQSCTRCHQRVYYTSAASTNLH